jgi:NAD-dependent SIR2 family protein deacetylase
VRLGWRKSRKEKNLDRENDSSNRYWRGIGADNMVNSENIMAIDFGAQEFQLLLRQFERGSVVLFAGAGFSVGARNSLGQDPPLGTPLAEALAHECCWAYSGEELSIVYDEAQKQLGTERLRQFLNSRYRDCTPAEWHKLAAQLIWYRIYTTNIDDVIESAYRAGAQRFRRIVCPANYEEHDPWYEGIQCVHLHGSVLEPDKGFTFSPVEYGEQTAKPNPWYQALIDDMQANSVIFVGTRLNETPMYHYLALRTERTKGVPEARAKAFVVSPQISPIRRRQLESQGYVVVDMEAQHFLDQLYSAVRKRVPDRNSVLMNRYPHQIRAITEGVFQSESEFLRQFQQIRVDSLSSRNYSSLARQRRVFLPAPSPDCPRGGDGDCHSRIA